MWWQNFTERGKKAFKTAQQEALRLGHEIVGTEHILLALLKDSDPYTKMVLDSCGIKPADLADEIERYAGIGTPRTDAIDLPISPRAKTIMDLSMREARKCNVNYVGTEHILMAILAEGEGLAARLLASHGVTLEGCRQLAQENTKRGKAADNAERAYQQEAHYAGFSRGRVRGSILEELATDLTQLAAEGKLDPVIGRAKETQRLVQILSRRTKNNPVLIGEPGVGKTAVVEGLAQRIVGGVIPEILKDKRVMQLNIAGLVAGTKYRGEFEERMRRLINEIKTSKNVIIFMDEIHTIVGAGGAEGALDAANVLKPSLSRGEFQVIGATTIDEYRKHIEKDAALERRFQPVIVDEPTVEETKEILNGLKSKYEEHHKVIITEDAVSSAAELSKRYITDRFLPDKAIDLIDEASAIARISTLEMPEDIKALEETAEDIKAEKEAAAAAQEFEKAANLRDEEYKAREKFEALRAEWKSRRNNFKPEVTSAEIATLVSQSTGIPVAQITETESRRLLRMEEELHHRIVGQNDAITAVSKAIRRARSGMKDPRRPVGSFLFLGPTGVGKTELAKTLAEFLFGSEDALLRFDMSEYMERHEVAKLIGAPPGYVGFEDGGKLTEMIRRKPYSVVLFDEIEKAHHDVFNILLQLLEDGKLTDGHGHTSDFRNSVIIMTSNVGVNETTYLKTVGFGMTDEADKLEKERIKSVIDSAVKKTFRPEFLNRIDEILTFTPLSKDELLQIVGIMLKDVKERARENGIELALDKSAELLILDKGYDPKFGARPLRRTIQKMVEDEIANLMLDGKISGTPSEHSSLVAAAEGEKIVFK